MCLDMTAYCLRITTPRRTLLSFVANDVWARKLADITKAQLATSGTSTENTLGRCDGYLHIACKFQPSRAQRGMGLLQRMKTRLVSVGVRIDEGIIVNNYRSTQTQKYFLHASTTFDV